MSTRVQKHKENITFSQNVPRSNRKNNVFDENVSFSLYYRDFWIEMLHFHCTIMLFGPWAHKVPRPGPGSPAQVAHGPGSVLGLGRGALQVPALGPLVQGAGPCTCAAISIPRALGPMWRLLQYQSCSKIALGGPFVKQTGPWGKPFLGAWGRPRF